MVSETGPGVTERIAYGFRLCLGRRPSEADLEDLTALYRDQLEHLSDSAPSTTNSHSLSGVPEEHS